MAKTIINKLIKRVPYIEFVVQGILIELDVKEIFNSITK